MRCDSCEPGLQSTVDEIWLHLGGKITLANIPNLTLHMTATFTTSLAILPAIISHDAKNLTPGWKGATVCSRQSWKHIESSCGLTM